MVTKDEIMAALARIPGPDGRASLAQTGLITGLAIEGDKVFATIEINPANAAAMEPVRAQIETAIKSVPGVGSALVTLTAEREAGAEPAKPAGGKGAPKRGLPEGEPIPGVKSIIAVASGKGGVGKSTTAANIAVGLAKLGLKVGVLDADIYGPSMPRLFGIKDKPEMANERQLLPLENHGVKVMSIGFLVDEDTPMVWRGPMVMSALTQLLREVAWAPLDVLVVDMPPGTGDAQLTMAQNVPLSGAVIVSTPQDLALLDARRGIAMFEQVNVPILGLVENMSYFVCPHCGTRSDIFAHGGARHEAERLNVPFLGEVPLEMTIRELSDGGQPVVSAQPDGPHAKVYLTIASAIRDRLMAGSAARPAPRIVIG